MRRWWWGGRVGWEHVAAISANTQERWCCVDAQGGRRRRGLCLGCVARCGPRCAGARVSESQCALTIVCSENSAWLRAGEKAIQELGVTYIPIKQSLKDMGDALEAFKLIPPIRK